MARNVLLYCSLFLLMFLAACSQQEWEPLDKPIEPAVPYNDIVENSEEPPAAASATEGSSLSIEEEPALAPSPQFVKKHLIPEGFVYLNEILPEAEFDIRYFSTDNFVGSVIDGYLAPLAILTTQAAEALKAVNDELAGHGYQLKIFDGYRPAKAVEHFVRWSEAPADQLMKEEYYPELDKKNLFKLGFIARRSGHSRGSTVDLTMIDAVTREEVDMGGSFDFFGDISYHDTALISDAQTANRKLLKEVMIRHGFKPYSKEWWHYTLTNEPFPNQYFDFDVQ